MVWPRGEKDRRRRSNKNMEESGRRKIGRPKLRLERSIGRISTRLENVEIENLLRRPPNREKAKQDEDVCMEPDISLRLAFSIWTLHRSRENTETQRETETQSQ